MSRKLRDQLFQQMEQKDLFDQARDYAFDYIDHSLERNVFPSNQAIHNLSQFDENLPESTTDPSQVINQLHQHGSPATVSQIGGRYFGLVNGGIIPVSLATKWLSDAWDQNTPLYVTSPIVSKLEEVCERWLQELLDLPENTVAGFVSGSSMSNLCCLAAARYRIFKNNGWDINEKGFHGAPTIRVITSQHSHGTVVKAISLLGIGIENIEWVNVDDQGRIIASQLPTLDKSCIVILQAGNVNSGSFDEFTEICDIARQQGSWVHIDGAFGLWAGACKDLKYLTKGMNKADSWSVDGHKTLNTPYDSGVVLCKDKQALVNALQASGAYIVYGEHRDGMLYTPEMSRRARVVELWATLKYLGKQGVDELVLGLHQRAAQLAQALRGENFEILNDVVFNQVLVAVNDDETTNNVIAHLQQSGDCWVGGSKWFDRAVIRVSVCSWATTKKDINRTVNAFVEARKKVL